MVLTWAICFIMENATNFTNTTISADTAVPDDSDAAETQSSRQFLLAQSFRHLAQSYWGYSIDSYEFYHFSLYVLLPLAGLAIVLGKRDIFSKLLVQLDRKCVAVFCPSLSSRERVIKWASARLPVTWSSQTRTLSGGIADMWTDGSLLCTILNSAIPGACPNPHRHWKQAPDHAQAIAYKYLNIPPMFTKEDFAGTFSLDQERNFLHYLSKLSSAIDNFVAAKDDKNQPVTLKYLARGMGLFSGEQYKSTCFYIYSNQEAKFVRNDNILILIRGPYSTFGRAEIVFDKNPKITVQNVTQSEEFVDSNLKSKPSLLRQLSRDLTSFMKPEKKAESSDIEIKIHYEDSRVKVIYRPNNFGMYEINLVTNGEKLMGCPFYVHIIKSNTNFNQTNNNTKLDDDIPKKPESDYKSILLENPKLKVVSKTSHYVNEEINFNMHNIYYNQKYHESSSTTTSSSGLSTTSTDLKESKSDDQTDDKDDNKISNIGEIVDKIRFDRKVKDKLKKQTAFDEAIQEEGDSLTGKDDLESEFDKNLSNHSFINIIVDSDDKNESKTNNELIGDSTYKVFNESNLEKLDLDNLDSRKEILNDSESKNVISGDSKLKNDSKSDNKEVLNDSIKSKDFLNNLDNKNGNLDRLKSKKLDLDSSKLQNDFLNDSKSNNFVSDNCNIQNDFEQSSKSKKDLIDYSDYKKIILDDSKTESCLINDSKSKNDFLPIEQSNLTENESFSTQLNISNVAESSSGASPICPSHIVPEVDVESKLAIKEKRKLFANSNCPLCNQESVVGVVAAQNPDSLSVLNVLGSLKQIEKEFANGSQETGDSSSFESIHFEDLLDESEKNSSRISSKVKIFENDKKIETSATHFKEIKPRRFEINASLPNITCRSMSTNYLYDFESNFQNVFKEKKSFWETLTSSSSTSSSLQDVSASKKKLFSKARSHTLSSIHLKSTNNNQGQLKRGSLTKSADDILSVAPHSGSKEKKYKSVDNSLDFCGVLSVEERKKMLLKQNYEKEIEAKRKLNYRNEKTNNIELANNKANLIDKLNDSKLLANEIYIHNDLKHSSKSQFFRKAINYFKKLENSNEKVKLERSHSLDGTSLKNTNKSAQGGSLNLPKVSQRFSISNLYSDVFGSGNSFNNNESMRKGSFKGTPNKSFVLDALSTLGISKNTSFANESEDDIRFSLFKGGRKKQRPKLSSIFDL